MCLNISNIWYQIINYNFCCIFHFQCLMVSEVLHTLASCYHRQGKKILKWIRKKREEEEEKAGVKSLHIAIHYYM